MSEETLFERLCELDKHRMELQVTKTLLEVQRERYKTNIRLMNRMNTTICPHCAEIVDPEEITARIAKLNETIPEYDEPIRQAEQLVKEATKRWSEIRTFPQPSDPLTCRMSKDVI